MSVADEIKAEIEAAWCNQLHVTEARGAFLAGPLRAGGATDALLTIASEIAAARIEAEVGKTIDVLAGR